MDGWRRGWRRKRSPGATLSVVVGRGLHSSTCQLNLSCFVTESTQTNPGIPKQCSRLAEKWTSVSPWSWDARDPWGSSRVHGEEPCKHPHRREATH